MLLWCRPSSKFVAKLAVYKLAGGVVGFSVGELAGQFVRFAVGELAGIVVKGWIPAVLSTVPSCCFVFSFMSMLDCLLFVELLYL